MINLGHQLRAARIEQGLTQGEVATRAGLSQGTVSAIELGRMDPSLKALFAILRVLDLALVLTTIPNGGAKNPR